MESPNFSVSSEILRNFIKHIYTIYVNLPESKSVYDSDAFNTSPCF